MTIVSVEHIALDEKGVARIAGTRSRVTNVVLDARNGLTPEQIHKEYPHLSMAQIHAALAYYFDHQAELDAAIEAELRGIESMRSQSDQSPRLADLKSRTTDAPG